MGYIDEVHRRGTSTRYIDDVHRRGTSTRYIDGVHRRGTSTGYIDGVHGYIVSSCPGLYLHEHYCLLSVQPQLALQGSQAAHARRPWAARDGPSGGRLGGGGEYHISRCLQPNARSQAR